MPDGGSVTLLVQGGGGAGIGMPVRMPDTMVLNLDFVIGGMLLAVLKKQQPGKLPL